MPKKISDCVRVRESFAVSVRPGRIRPEQIQNFANTKRFERNRARDVLRFGNRGVGSIQNDCSYSSYTNITNQFSHETTVTKMKIIQGARRELEYELLTALFTPGADATAESLKRRLAPRGKDQIRAVSTPAFSMSGKSSPSPRPTEEGDET